MHLLHIMRSDSHTLCDRTQSQALQDVFVQGMAGTASKPEHIEQQTEEALCKITYKLLSCQSQVPPKTHSWRSGGKEKAESLPELRDWNKLVVRYTKGGARLNSGWD